MTLNLFSNLDQHFMKEALLEAQKAYEAREVPVGAVLVHEGKVLARAHNQMESRKDPSAHAELEVIRLGAQALGDWRLVGTTLYSTLEPCSMCAGAILLSRIDRLVWGAPDIRHGANGSWVDLLEGDHPTHTLEVQKGLFEEEAGHLMRTFFQEQRKKHDKAHIGSAL